MRQVGCETDDIMITVTYLIRSWLLVRRKRVILKAWMVKRPGDKSVAEVALGWYVEMMETLVPRSQTFTWRTKTRKGLSYIFNCLLLSEMMAER